MRLAGKIWLPPANQMGEGCATEPQKYPAKPKGGMSHGPKLLGQRNA